LKSELFVIFTLLKLNIIGIMKKELITELFKKFEEACYDLDGLECWSGRELQEILGY
jgi:hypothetical protein